MHAEADNLFSYQSCKHTVISNKNEIVRNIYPDKFMLCQMLLIIRSFFFLSPKQPFYILHVRTFP